MSSVGEYMIKLDAVNAGTVRVGIKANRLGSMLAAGLSVSPGFVINTEAYIKFLRHNKIANKISRLHEGSHSANPQELREISSQIQSLIMNGTMPDFIESGIREEYQDLSIGREAKEVGGAAFDLIRAGRDNIFVTIRPSPTSGGMISPNFSGQMKTILSQRGYSKIIYAVKECWASLFSPRAMLHRKRKRIRDIPAMGVIIQKSLEPDKAGFAYTNIPESGDSSKVVIEGSWGFSESIISGTVSPDEYIIDKETGKTDSKKIRKKTWMKKRNEMTGNIEREPVFRERVNAELLDSKEIRKIYELCARVEKHFGGHPQEIEWCDERGRIFLLDSNPVPDYGIPSSAGNLPPGLEPLASGTCAYRGSLRARARIINSMSDTERIEKGDIMVTNMTIPEMVPVMDNISGIITDEGSRSCHAAVLAREFGIPCIVSAGNSISTFTEGQEIMLDATEGRVYSIPEIPPGIQGQNPSMQLPYAPQPFQQPATSFQPVQGTAPHQSPGNHVQIPPFNPPGIEQAPTGAPSYVPEGAQEDKQAPTGAQADNGGINPPQEIPPGLGDDGITATGIKTIVSVPGTLGNSHETSDGVGLIKAEHMIIDKGKHPFYLVKHNPEELISSLASGLGSIAKAFYPKPVWYRSIDVRTDEFRELEGGIEEPSENNPMMGWHGIRRSLDQPDLLKIEIEVIRKLHEEGLDNIMLGIPFVSSVDELKRVKQLAGPSIKIGIMVETPAAGLGIEEFCKEGIAFAAIGLNDLTQLTLGVDRDNSMISKLYSEMNPAVTNLLKHIFRTCRKHSVETSVYGDSVSDQMIVESLVSLGVGSISTEPENLEGVRSVISRTERRLILESMRNRPGAN